MGHLLPTEATLLAFDLPFHGETIWQKAAFKPNDVVELIQACQELVERNKTYLLGFSFGGRVVISSLMESAHLIDGLILLASDGPYSAYVNTMANMPGWMGDVFPPIIQKSRFLIPLSKGLQKAGVIQPFAANFVTRYFNNPNEQILLAGMGKSARYFRLTPHEFAGALTIRPLPTLAVYGSRDVLIPYEKYHDLINV